MHSNQINYLYLGGKQMVENHAYSLRIDVSSDENDSTFLWIITHLFISEPNFITSDCLLLNMAKPLLMYHLELHSL